MYEVRRELMHALDGVLEDYADLLVENGQCLYFREVLTVAGALIDEVTGGRKEAEWKFFDRINSEGKYLDPLRLATGLAKPGIWVDRELFKRLLITLETLGYEKNEVKGFLIMMRRLHECKFKGRWAEKAQYCDNPMRSQRRFAIMQAKGIEHLIYNKNITVVFSDGG